uniref:Uncharacterized protein n=1 Tax=Leersia perrieri TaxID=77586 RepID=A0A0D9XM51_9ORYZ
MWWFNRKGASGFSGASTAEEVTAGVDARGLLAVITGASSGIGLETARVLAMRGVRVVMAVRNVAAGHKASEAIRADIPGAGVHVLELDLSSMDSILTVVVNINNAGIMTRDCTLSIDGLELQFATNHIDYIKLLTFLTRFFSFVAYGQSKLANILHSSELSRVLKDNQETVKYEQGDCVNISVNAVHPGVVTTNLFRNRTIINALVNSIGRIICKTVEQGAATTCYVALHPRVTGISGKYFGNCNLETPSSKASNSELARKLWEFSSKIVSS